MMLEGRKVLWVAGGRDFEDRLHMEAALKARVIRGFDVLIEGAARGADLLAEDVWRSRFQLPYIGIPAQWNSQGKSAGYQRNVVIAEQGPDALLALPGGRGTQHARDIAREYGIPILDEL